MSSKHRTRDIRKEVRTLICLWTVQAIGLGMRFEGGVFKKIAPPKKPFGVKMMGFLQHVSAKSGDCSQEETL